MSTVLSNGVIVPDVGSTNWASDLEINWTLLNALIGAVGANVRLDRPNIWTAAQTFSEGIYGDLDGTAAMAVSDANGNEIATTYALKTEVTALATAVSSKAADDSVVHLAGAETISGDKTWTGINAFTSPVHAVTNQSVPIAENPPAEIVGNNFRFIDNDRFWGQFVPVWGTDGSFRIELGISNWTTAGSQGYWALSTKVSKDFSTLSFYTSHANANLGTPSNSWNTVWTQAVRAPGTSNALILAAMETWEDGARIFMYGKDNANGSTLYADIDHDDGNHSKTGVSLNKYGFYPAGVSRHLGLADANNRWLTFNGINPGALSFPGASTVDLSGNITDINGGINEYTPAVNGWVQIVVPNAADAYLSVRSYYSPYSGDCVMGNSSTLARLCITVPVRSGIKHVIYVKAASITSAVFRPCLGNV